MRKLFFPIAAALLFTAAAAFSVNAELLSVEMDVVVRPDGKAAVSSGAERELQHAHEAAKEVYVIWASKQRPSVFVTQTATRVFGDMDEAAAFFESKGYIRK